MMKPYDLEERLVLYSSEVIGLCEKLPSSYAATHLSKQLVRSGTSAALNYGEAKGAESPNDFIHKLKVAVKELRESRVCLKIIHQRKYGDPEKMSSAIQETNELISILVTSIKTAREGKNR